MPRTNNNHNWQNQDSNRLNSRNGIPSERQALLNRARGIERTEEVTFRNRQERREHGNREPVNSETPSYDGSGILFENGSRICEVDLAREYERSSQLTSFQTEMMCRMWESCPSTMNVTSNQYIKSYNYIPSKFNFNKVNDEEDLFLGIELEIDKGGERDENAKMILDILGESNCYIMHDGSLRAGLEITTHPCTYEYHKQLPYEELFKKLSDKGYRSHDTATCGFHIHINKDYFSKNATNQDLCITKLLYLVEKYWDNIVVFSRRDINSLNRWASRYEMTKDESMFELLYKAKQCKNLYGAGKYKSVNLRHENTIEIRVFRGTLKYETFIATLQFVKKLAEVCKQYGIEDIQLMTWEDLFKECEEELIDYMKEKKLIK